jgi:uncharacterized protein YkwD
LTSIVSGLTAIVAVLAVALSGHQLSVSTAGDHHHSVPAPVKWSKTYSEPAGTDAYTWLHGHNNRPTAIPTPSPTPAPAAAVQPAVRFPVVAPAPRPLPPPVVVGSTQQALINSDRAAAGLGALTWNPCLAGVAYQSALRMANQGFISHAGGPNQDLGCGLGSRAGENVGYWSGGITDGQLNTMFMNSPDHRANIMGPYRYVGTAWVVAGTGSAYIAVEFG